MLALRVVTLAAALALTAIEPANAGRCGDDVNGRRVACGCGDTVVSDTVLRPGDPVVQTRCPLDGLLVRADLDASSIRLDLAGLTLRGSGVASGIDVKYGGTDGAQIVGAPPGQHGVIEGFGIGLANARREAIARASRLELRGNKYDGARLSIAGTVLEDIVAHANRRDGLYVRGTGGRMAGVHSYDNLQNGIRMFTSGAAVEAVVDNNGRSGIVVDGADNDLSQVRSLDNMRDGVVARNSVRRSTVAKSEGNGRKDLVLSGLLGKTAGELR